jgi:hypothetical protein
MIILLAKGPVMVVVRRSLRRRLPLLLDCRCPLLCLWNLIFPVAVTLTRFLIPLWVFILGTCVPPVFHHETPRNVRVSLELSGGRETPLADPGPVSRVAQYTRFRHTGLAMRVFGVGGGTCVRIAVAMSEM